MNIVHWTVGIPVEGLYGTVTVPVLACDRRTWAHGFEIAGTTSEVSCLNCVRTRAFKDEVFKSGKSS